MRETEHSAWRMRAEGIDFSVTTQGDSMDVSVEAEPGTVTKEIVLRLIGGTTGEITVKGEGLCVRAE